MQNFEINPIQQSSEIVPQNNLAVQVLSQIDPFAQFVVRDLFDTASKPEERVWKLEEEIFSSADAEIDVEMLRMSSSKMFNVY